jgi:hypothetical protein
VLKLILPHNEPTVRTDEIEEALNVSDGCVYSFIRRGELRLVSGGRRGRNGAGHVATASFATFLRRRCYPFPVTDD